MSVYLVGAFALYLIFMLFIGFYFYRKTMDTSDYILGSRKLPPSVAALSAGASDLSGWALMGLPGAIYAGGLGNIWIVVFTLLGVYVNWTFIAPRLRRLTISMGDAQTIPEYLQNRFDHSRALRNVASIVTLLFFTLYVAAGLSGGAVLFEKTFGLDYDAAVIIGSVIIVSYTFLGGYLAVCWTDFFQGLMMAGSLFIVAFALFLSPQVDVNSVNITLSELKPEMGWGLGLISLAGWCIGYMGQPHVLVRFMSVRSQGEIKTSKRIAMIWSTITMISAIVVGVLGASYFSATPLDKPETVFIKLSQAIFHPFLAGIIIAGVLAAIMSTIDSQLLVCSSTISEDFYRGYINPKADDKSILRIARFSVVVIALIGIFIALDSQNKTLLSMVAYAWGGFGASFGPLILLSLFWNKMTANGAIAGLIVGAIVVVVWKNLNGGLFDMFEVVPGFILSTIAIVVISKLDKNPKVVDLS